MSKPIFGLSKTLVKVLRAFDKETLKVTKAVHEPDAFGGLDRIECDFCSHSIAITLGANEALVADSGRVRRVSTEFDEVLDVRNILTAMIQLYNKGE